LPCFATSGQRSVQAPGKLRSQIIDAATELLFSKTEDTNTEFNSKLENTQLVNGMIQNYFRLLTHWKLKASHLHDMLYLSSRAIVKFGTSDQNLEMQNRFFEELFLQIQSKLPDFNNRQMAIMVWSLGGLASNLDIKEDSSVQGFLIESVNWCSRRMSGFNEREVVRIIVAFVRLNSPKLSILTPALSEYIKRRKESFKPEDLCTIARCLGQMEVREGRPILEDLSGTIRSKIRSVTPQGLTYYLWSSAQLRAQLTPLNIEKILQKIEINLRILTPGDVARVLEGVNGVRFKPNFEFFDRVEVYLTHQISNFTPLQISQILKSCGSFNYAPETLIKITKGYILDYQERFPFHELCSMLSSFALLDALDLDLLKLVLSQAETLNEGPFRTESGEKRVNSEISDVQLRQIFQSALHLQLIKKEDQIQNIFPSGFFEICKGAWTVHHLFSPFNYVVSHLVQNFEYIGFKCESPFFETMSKLSLTCVRNEKGARILVEVVNEGNCFVNEVHQMKGEVKWRHRILKALGWPLMIIFEDDWMALDFQEQAQYLSENILPLLH